MPREVTVRARTVTVPLEVDAAIAFEDFRKIAERHVPERTYVRA